MALYKFRIIIIIIIIIIITVLLQASTAALCIEKSNAVNRYQFNRYIVFGFLSLCDSG